MDTQDLRAIKERFAEDEELEQVSQINVSLKGRISELEHQVTRFQAEQKVQEEELIRKSTKFIKQESQLRGQSSELTAQVRDLEDKL